MPRPGSLPLDIPLHQGQKGELHQTWKGWLQAVSSLFATSSTATTPAVGASPFTYRNTTSSLQQAIVTGTITSIQFSRDGVTYYAVTAPVVLSGGDFLKITYPAAAPTLVISPL